MLLALDPGMNSPGVALFEHATLIAADRVRVPVAVADLEPGERWHSVASYIVVWYDDKAGAGIALPEVIFERPQWYARAKSKGDPNDLAGVAGVAGNVCGLLNHSRIYSPTPAEWIGQLPKVCPACKGKAKRKCAECHGSAWETPRGRRIRSRLTLDERALVPDQNDAIDAVGLGLFALGRLTPRSAFSNGK